MSAILGIDHIQLAISPGGEALARSFYCNVLGLDEIPKPENLAKRGGAWFQCGALQLHLGVEADFRPARKAHPALLVENLSHFVSALEREGFVIKNDEPLSGFNRIFTNDPFGNRVELMERQL